MRDVITVERCGHYKQDRKLGDLHFTIIYYKTTSSSKTAVFSSINGTLLMKHA